MAKNQLRSMLEYFETLIFVSYFCAGVVKDFQLAHQGSLTIEGWLQANV